MHMTASSPFDQQRPIPGVKHILAVFAGKGGVGKSTVATNLALALSKKYKVGILDADIYGPSLPRMLGALHQKPEVSADNKIQPIVRYGVKIMSLGFLVEESAAVVWRGPMLFKAMDQFLFDVNWGDLDVLVVDLPPGTGDVQLSLAQKIPVTGAVGVSTPQNISFIDVRKAIDMWKRTQIPVLGLLENMSYMIVPGTQERIQMFPKGELGAYLDNEKIQKLGEIPFNPNVSLASEAGIPIVESNPSGAEAEVFFKAADELARKLGL